MSPATQCIERAWHHEYRLTDPSSATRKLKRFSVCAGWQRCQMGLNTSQWLALALLMSVVVIIQAGRVDQKVNPESYYSEGANEPSYQVCPGPCKLTTGSCISRTEMAGDQAIGCMHSCRAISMAGGVEWHTCPVTS